MNVLKINIIFLVFLSHLLYCQSRLFFYDYKFISDSTKRNVVENELMVLNITDRQSEFYSLNQYKSDSILISNSNKGIFSMPSNVKMIGDRVVKYNKSNKIDFITIVANNQYIVEQEINFKWNLLNQFDEILGFKVQKATTEFGGRFWIAWFATDIPIQNGPYKFSGLPGLILKVEDDGQNHILELKGIKDLNANLSYPDLNNFKKNKIKYLRYVKIYDNDRKNPGADLLGQIPDYTDSNGQVISGQQKAREIEQIRKEQIKKDNNIMEINLLQKKSF